MLSNTPIAYEYLAAKLQQNAMVLAITVAMVALSTCLLLRHVHRYSPKATERINNIPEVGFWKALDSLRVQYALTTREYDMLVYLSHGYSRPYIEKSLCIARNTVKTHISHLYRKLGVGTQDELIDLVISTRIDR